MKNNKMAVLGLSALALMGSLPTASGVLTTLTDFNNTARNFYTPSSTDLINGVSPTSSTYNGQFEGGTGQASLPAFTDGSTGSATATTIGQVLFDRDSLSWNVVYTLNTSLSPLGYDISSIVSFAGHGDSRVNQTFNIEVQLVGGGGFVSLASVIYNAVPSAQPNGNYSTRVTLQDSTPGVAIASGVAAIRFTALPPAQNVGNQIGGSIYRELDVIGTPTSVPEASTAALVGLVGLAGVARRRRSA